jgi:hypothetical protein
MIHSKFSREGRPQAVINCQTCGLGPTQGPPKDEFYAGSSCQIDEGRHTAAPFTCATAVEPPASRGALLEADWTYNHLHEAAP